MYAELKKDIEDYKEAHPGVPMTKAPRLLEPFVTTDLAHIKPEDVDQAREDFKLKVTLG